MNYTVERLEKSQIKFNYTVDASAYNDAVNVAYAQNKGKYNVPGFRKGHAPRKMIEGMYGPYVFFSDAVNHLVDLSIDELYGKEEYKIVSVDSVDDVDTLDDGGVKYSLTVTVSPEVKLGEYKGLGLTKNVAEVKEEDIDKAVEEARRKNVRIFDRDGDYEAKTGDKLTLDYVGKIDGAPFDGGSAQNQELTLGSGEFIPGFEEALLGVKTGEHRDINVTFPEDYGATELAGKAAVFECDVKKIATEELPVVDDEFVKDVSEFSTLAEYRADLKTQLEKEADKKGEREYEDALIDKIVENAEVDIPDSMISNEVDDMVKSFEEQLKSYNFNLKQYCQISNVTEEKIREEYKPVAQSRVKMRLVLEALIEKEEVKLSDEEIEKKIADFADESGLTAEEYKKTLSHQAFDYIVNSAMTDKLLALVKSFNEEGAKSKPAKKSSKKSAEKEVEAAPDEAPAEPEKKATKKTKATVKKAEAESETLEAAPKAEKPAKKTTKKASEEALAADKVEPAAPKKKAPAKKTAKKTESDGDKTE